MTRRPSLASLPVAIARDVAATCLFFGGVCLGPIFGAPLVKLACVVAGR